MRLRDCDFGHVMDAWASIREWKPLIFHITNAVAVAFSANVCLAVGASPLMSQYPEEAEELIALSHGFLVNLGTPTEAALATARRGLKAANSGAAETGEGCFTLLDPVGYGASRFRTESTNAFLKEYPFSIVKGNAGEMSLLAGAGGTTRGVDAFSTGDLKKGVFDLARNYRCVACATGEVDHLSDGESIVCVRGGSSLLPYLSGSGCAAGTVVLSATAACGDAVTGTLCGLLAMGIASERAEKRCTGSGTFAAHLIDELYRLRPGDFADCRSRWDVL